MNLLEVCALLLRLLQLSLEGSLGGGEGDDAAVEHLEVGAKPLELLHLLIRILGARLESLSLRLRSREGGGGGSRLLGISLRLRLRSRELLGISLCLLQSCLERSLGLVGISLGLVGVSLGLGLSRGGCCSLVGVSLGLGIGSLLLVLESLEFVGHVGELNLQLLSLGGVGLLGLIGGGERRVGLGERGTAILGSLELIREVLLSLGELLLGILLLLLELGERRLGRLRGGLGRGREAGGRRELSLELLDLILELLKLALGLVGGSGELLGLLGGGGGELLGLGSLLLARGSFAVERPGRNLPGGDRLFEVSLQLGSLLLCSSELGGELLLSRGDGVGFQLVSLGGGGSLRVGSLPLSLELALQLLLSLQSRGERILRHLERRRGLFLVGVALAEEVSLELVLCGSERGERGFRLGASLLDSLGEVGLVLGPVRLASFPLGLEDGLELGLLGVVPLDRGRVGLGRSLLFDLLALIREFLLERSLFLLNLPGGVLQGSLLRGDGLLNLPVRRHLGVERLTELRLERVHLLLLGLDLIREFLLEHGLLLRDLREVLLHRGRLRLGRAQGRLELSLLLEDLILEFLDLSLGLLELGGELLDLLGGGERGGFAADSHLLEFIRRLDGFRGELSLLLRRRALERGELLREGVLRSLLGARLLVGDAVRALLGGERLLEVGGFLLVSLGVVGNLLVELSLLRGGGLAVLRECIVEPLIRSLPRVDGDAELLLVEGVGGFLGGSLLGEFRLESLLRRLELREGGLQSAEF